MRSFRRNPNSIFKLLSAVLILGFYLLYSSNNLAPDDRQQSLQTPGPRVQHQTWLNNSGAADQAKADAVQGAMRFTFWRYRSKVWGADDIKPVSGESSTSRNGWGAFIVDASTTLALMGLWEELGLAVKHIITSIDFTHAEGLVDPFETTIRYLGALVSLVDLVDAGVVPEDVVSKEQRDAVLAQAEVLAKKLMPAYNTPTGMPWKWVDFTTDRGQGDYPEDKHQAIGPTRSGSNILENRVLSRLTGNSDYFAKATRSWTPLVWNRYVEQLPGIVDAPIDVSTGAPVGRQRHWDASHDSYYEYLIKAVILAPHDRYSNTYKARWLQAAQSVRHHLVSRSSPTEAHPTQHLFLGKHENGAYINTMSHLACFAPGNLMLGGRHLGRPDLVVLGQAVLEACRHTYVSSPLGIGPEKFSWVPMSVNITAKPHEEPSTSVHASQLRKHGFWVTDASYRLRPEYVESLFYGFRITGQERYRQWAREAFQAMEKHCKVNFGYAGIRDVMVTEGDVEYRDESESFWGAETLKYLWLVFADVGVGDLDEWVFSTEGHPFRRMVGRMRIKGRARDV